MPLPTWVVPGVALQRGEGGVPHEQAFVFQVNQSGAHAHGINSPIDNPTIHIAPEEFLRREWIPHRWIEHVEIPQAALRLRAVYRNGVEWEARGAEVIPAWPIIGDHGPEDEVDPIIRRGPGAEVFIVARPYPRTSMVRLQRQYDTSSHVDVPLDTLAVEYAPYYALRVGASYVLCGTRIWHQVVSHTGDVVEYDTPEGLRSTSTESFILSHDAYGDRMMRLPNWVRVGTTLRHIQSRERVRIATVDPILRTIETESGPLPFDTLINEWVPDLVAAPPAVRRRQSEARQYVGSYWGFVNPPALVRITHEAQGVGGESFEERSFTVRIVGSDGIEILSGDDLRLRSTAQGNFLSGSWSGSDTWEVGGLRHMADGRYFFVASRVVDGGVPDVLLVSDFHLGYEDNHDLELSTEVASPPMALDQVRDRYRRMLAQPAPSTVATDLQVGSLHAWYCDHSINALVEVVAQSPVTVDIRIVPSVRVERVPRAVFDLNTTELAYRNTIDDYASSVPAGSILDVDDGPVAVGEPQDGRFVVYSTRALAGEDGARYSSAMARGSAPESLGYNVPEHVPAPVEAGTPSVPCVGQQWMLNGSPVSVRRLGRDHRVVWVAGVDSNGAVSGKVRGVSFDRLNAEGRLILEGVDHTPAADPPPAPAPERDEWRHVVSTRLCEVVSYDEKKRTAQLRWISPGEPREETVKVAALVEGFRALTSEARARAMKIHNAKGRPAWARLRD